MIEYLKTENQVYREHLGGKRIRFTDDRRHRLAAKTKVLGRKALSELSSCGHLDAAFIWPTAFELSNRRCKMS